MYVCIYVCTPKSQSPDRTLNNLGKEVQNPKTEISFPSTGGGGVVAQPKREKKKNFKKGGSQLDKSFI